MYYVSCGVFSQRGINVTVRSLTRSYYRRQAKAVGLQVKNDSSCDEGRRNEGGNDLQGSQRFKYYQEPIEETRLIGRSPFIFTFYFFFFSFFRGGKSRRAESGSEDERAK